jgi:hypothetical protein
MEKKSLGRGLNDISDIFLSEVEHEDVEKYKETLSEISSATAQNENCHYCINLIEKFSEPKCKIFTFQNEIYAVPYMEKITHSQGKYCKYFNPIPTIKTDRLLNKKNRISEPTDTECEVEEIIKVARKIAYPNAENSQKRIRKSLVEHLKEGYKIKSCKLRKTDNISTIGKKESREVEVTICTKET